MTCIFSNSGFLLTQLKKKGGFLLLFPLGPGVVPVSLAAGRLCQSEGVWEGPSEQSPGPELNQGQGEQVSLPGLCSAALWGRGLGQEGRGADSSGQVLAPMQLPGPFLTSPGQGTTRDAFGKYSCPTPTPFPLV